MKFKLIYFFLFLGLSLSAQTAEELEEVNAKDLAESTNLTWEGNKQISEDKFTEAEKEYRRAISKSDKNVAAPFNLGNAYYNKETYSEAFGRFKEAGDKSEDKAEKHKAYHNMGNVFMKRKEYEKAVEAYKEALRNNPKDEETRYNLALAKEMFKKEQDEQKNDDENKDDQNQDQDDKKDDQEKNEDKKEDGDKKEDEGENEEENKDKQDEGDKGEQEKEDNKEGEGDEKDEQEKKPEEQQQAPPRPNQLSKQQIQNLLDAMQNEEDKVQEKIDAQKVKGAKVKNEKDW
ncbi:tetratricopeptide repeat protein [Aurantibacter sp.]|uniref:tetratricopeptide repeat protein n=1 Tax=Aurantibacter sp. TaxID=2807103 RepID=UPI003267D295